MNLTIRRGDASDHPWLLAVGADAFADLGDYGAILGAWLGQPGVSCWIADAPGQRLGFLMLGFFVEPEVMVPAGHEVAPTLFADLLAIAVARPARGLGIGRRLLAHAVELSRQAAQAAPVRELRLSVAESNQLARAMYLRAGFSEVPSEPANYARAQRAIRMTRAL